MAFLASCCRDVRDVGAGLGRGTARQYCDETPAGGGVMLLIRPARGHQTGAPAHGGQVGPKPSRETTRRQLSVESRRATEDASLASTPDGAPPASLTVSGQHALDPDAVAAEEADSAPEEAGGGRAFLVLEHFDVGE